MGMGGPEAPRREVDAVNMTDEEVSAALKSMLRGEAESVGIGVDAHDSAQQHAEEQQATKMVSPFVNVERGPTADELYYQNVCHTLPNSVVQMLQPYPYSMNYEQYIGNGISIYIYGEQSSYPGRVSCSVSGGSVSYDVTNGNVSICDRAGDPAQRWHTFSLDGLSCQSVSDTGLSLWDVVQGMDRDAIQTVMSCEIKDPYEIPVEGGMTSQEVKDLAHQFAQRITNGATKRSNEQTYEQEEVAPWADRSSFEQKVFEFLPEHLSCALCQQGQIFGTEIQIAGTNGYMYMYPETDVRNAGCVSVTLGDYYLLFNPNNGTLDLKDPYKTTTLNMDLLKRHNPREERCCAEAVDEMPPQLKWIVTGEV